jgi:hypothetical protein
MIETEKKIIVEKEIDPLEPVHQYVPANARTRELLQVSEWTPLEEIIRRTMVQATS